MLDVIMEAQETQDALLSLVQTTVSVPRIECAVVVATQKGKIEIVSEFD